MTNTLGDILLFLDDIGLEYQRVKVKADSFMSGLNIRSGVLQIDETALKHPGDILHEAGHIAITAASLRPKLQGNVAKCGHGPAQEMAAIAWSWAALKHIKLQPEVVFHEQGYKGEASAIITAFEAGRGFGTPLLAYWHMCSTATTSDVTFPKMLSWLRADA